MKLTRLIISILIGITLVTSCHKKHSVKSADQKVKQFIKKIEKPTVVTTPQQHNATSFSNVTYKGKTERNPFESSKISKNSKHYPNTILKNISLDSLKLVGVMTHENKRWAIFRANDGKLYKMTEGMRVGITSALLTKIDSDHVVFLEDLEMGAEKKTNLVVIPIEEQKQ